MERRIKSVLLLAMLVMAISGHLILPGTNIDDCTNLPSSSGSSPNSPQRPNGGSSQLPNPNGNQNAGVPQTHGFGFPQFPGSSLNLNPSPNTAFPQNPGFGLPQGPNTGFSQFPNPTGNLNNGFPAPSFGFPQFAGPNPNLNPTQNTGFPAPGFGFPQFPGSNPIGNSNPNGPQFPGSFAGSQIPGFGFSSGSNPSLNPNIPQFPGFGFPGFPSNNGNVNPGNNGNVNPGNNGNANPGNNGNANPGNNGNLPPGSIVLDSQSKSCTDQQLQLEGGQTQITFDYLSNSKTATKSVLIVKFDGETAQTIKPSQSGSKVKLSGYIAKGVHLLTFCPQGDSSEQNFQHAIANIAINNVPLTQQPTLPQNCKPTYGDNIIVNGDFELNGCKGASRCGYNISNYQPSILPGWRPNPEIEVALGYVQNCDAFPNTQNYVSELDALTGNTCISQKIQVDNGKVQLKFSYAARAGVLKAGTGLSPENCRFVIKIGGKVIKEITPADERLHREVYEFDLGTKGTFDLEFCGAGTSDGYGANIDNVEFANAVSCV